MVLGGEENGWGYGENDLIIFILKKENFRL